MTRSLLPVLCLLLFTACPAAPEGGPDGGGVPDGGQDAGTGFTLQTLDATPTEREPLAVALLPNDKVGVAYFLKIGVDTQGVNIYDLRYLEWDHGTVTPSVKIDTVKRVVGLALAVQPNGQPAIAYLGGNDTTQAFWFQNDAYLASRAVGGAWATQVVVRTSDEAPGNAVSNAGFLVGLHPALAYDGAVAYLAYRDCHNGQSPQGDYNASDVEVARLSGGSWQKVVAIGADGVTVGKQGFGGHNQLLIANGAATLVFDRIIGLADGPGTDVYFMRRDPGTGAWSAPQQVLAAPNTQTGPSYAYDAQFGYGVAAVDRNSNKLSFVSSADGTAWTVPDTIWNFGTGGWYPSLAVDPATHEPEVAYYYCDNRTGISEGDCRPDNDELRIASRLSRWSTRTVDPAGGYLPKLLFLSSGKRVVVYRDVSTSGPTAASVKIAVEQ